MRCITTFSRGREKQEETFPKRSGSRIPVLDCTSTLPCRRIPSYPQLLESIIQKIISLGLRQPIGRSPFTLNRQNRSYKRSSLIQKLFGHCRSRCDSQSTCILAFGILSFNLLPFGNHIVSRIGLINPILFSSGFGERTCGQRSQQQSQDSTAA